MKTVCPHRRIADIVDAPAGSGRDRAGGTWGPVAKRFAAFHEGSSCRRPARKKQEDVHNTHARALQGLPRLSRGARGPYSFTRVSIQSNFRALGLLRLSVVLGCRTRAVKC